jgi:hypothetical protein
MNTEKWNPGYHATNKFYPYEGIESKKHFKNRPVVKLADEEKSIIIDVSANDIDITNKDAVIKQLSSCIHAYDLALKVAEDQIEAILTEEPFIPEDFGFELIHNPAPHEFPIRLYQSKFDDRYTIHSKPYETETYKHVKDYIYSGEEEEGLRFTESLEEFNPSLWVITKKEGDSKFITMEVSFPCHRIAFGYFTAIGLQVSEIEKNFVLAEVKETAPETEQSLIEKQSLGRTNRNSQTTPVITYVIGDSKEDEIKEGGFGEGGL